MAVLFEGGIPVWQCLFYNVFYTIFLIIYSPGRIEYDLTENFFNSVPFWALLYEILPFIIARVTIIDKYKDRRSI